MVKSATDDETRTASGVRPTRKPLAAKVIVMGSIPTADIDFLAWQSVHCPRLGARDAMLMYVRYLNGEDKIRFEQEMEQWKTYMRSRLSPEHRKELESLKARNDKLGAAHILIESAISEHKDLCEARNEVIALSPQNNSQNITPPPEQSSPQIHPAPPP
jgi:hypothetical protein